MLHQARAFCDARPCHGRPLRWRRHSAPAAIQRYPTAELRQRIRIPISHATGRFVDCGRAILSAKSRSGAVMSRRIAALVCQEIASFVAITYRRLACRCCARASLIGAIALGRRAAGPFSEEQIALLQDFRRAGGHCRCQCENIPRLNQRTADLQQSLEYQTATSEVLNVISRSTFDLEPVFQTVLPPPPFACATPIRPASTSTRTASIVGPADIPICRDYDTDRTRRQNHAGTGTRRRPAWPSKAARSHSRCLDRYTLRGEGGRIGWRAIHTLRACRSARRCPSA